MPKTSLYSFRLEEKKNITGDIAIQVSVQCQKCKHFDSYSPSCKAFPKGIPRKILDGKFDHRKKFPGQDNNIVFEKRKE